MAQSAIASPAPSVTDLLARVKPRPIEGISALPLPYREDGQPDLEAFAAHLERTVAAGLKPSVNMDTGEVYRAVAERMGEIIGFELGEMFAPFGWIFPIEVFAELIQIPGLVGMKHSSLDRAAEWERLALRDRVRPVFKLYTGNDLGIDM